MANIARILSQAVAKIDSELESVQPEVVWKRWASENSYGEVSFAAPIAVPAIVDKTSRDMPTSTGQMVRTGASIIFPRPLPPLGGITDRSEPVDTRDVFILPDGETGPILEINGFVNKETNAPFFVQVFLGATSKSQ